MDSRDAEPDPIFPLEIEEPSTSMSSQDDKEELSSSKLSGYDKDNRNNGGQSGTPERWTAQENRDPTTAEIPRGGEELGQDRYASPLPQEWEAAPATVEYLESGIGDLENRVLSIEDAFSATHVEDPEDGEIPHPQAYDQETPIVESETQERTDEEQAASDGGSEVNPPEMEAQTQSEIPTEAVDRSDTSVELERDVDQERLEIASKPAEKEIQTIEQQTQEDLIEFDDEHITEVPPPVTIAQHPQPESDPEVKRFFSQPVRVGLDNPILWETYDESESISKEKPVMMYISYTIIGLIILGIGGYYTYEHLVSPQSEEVAALSDPQKQDEATSNALTPENRPEKVSIQKPNPSDESVAHNRPEEVSAQNSEPSDSIQEPDDKAAEQASSEAVADPLQQETPNSDKRSAAPEAVATDEVTSEEEAAQPSLPMPVSQEKSKEDPEKAEANVDNQTEADKTSADRGATDKSASSKPPKSCCKTREEFEQTLQEYPNDPEILGKFAFFYLNRGKNQEAEKYAKNTVDIDPKNSLGWIVLGAARGAQGNRAGAQEAYQQCVKYGEGKYVRECRSLAR